MKGLKGPEELADLVDASLKKDSSGNSKLDAARCKLNGSCATANDYFNGIREKHPSSGLQDVSQLSRYIRGLKNALAKGEFYSARMVGNHLDMKSGFHRVLAPGEYAWYDTQTGESILMENCGNIMWPVPVEELVVTATTCVTINAYTSGGAQLDPAILLPAGEVFNDPHHCLAHQLVGEVKMTPGLPGPCNPSECDFGPSERQLNMKVVLLGKAKHLVEGDQMIRVPRGYTVVLCYTEADGTKHANQVIVGESYDGNGQAWVRRTNADKPGAYAVNWHPWPQ
jgi:hypothetical protein